MNADRIAPSIVSSLDGSVSSPRDEVLVRLLAAATAALDSDRDQAKAFVQQATQLLRVSLDRGECLRNQPSLRGSLARWQAKRVVDFIDSNISLSFQVADLARVVRLSVSHFTRAFTATFGQPPLAYVRARRMRHAQVIMLSTREPLSQVALDCGMNDQAHFNRLFRKLVGVSPGLWRRQFQSEPISAEGTPRQATYEAPNWEGTSALPALRGEIPSRDKKYAPPPVE